MQAGDDVHGSVLDTLELFFGLALHRPGPPGQAQRSGSERWRASTARDPAGLSGLPWCLSVCGAGGSDLACDGWSVPADDWGWAPLLGPHARDEGPITPHLS